MGDESFSVNQDLQTSLMRAQDEIESLKKELNKTITAGNNLISHAVDSSCQCRRAWVCHRCVAIEGWKQVRGV